MDNPHSNESESAVTQELRRRITQVMHGRQTKAESTRTIAGQGNAGLKPDVLITAKGRAPVIIEAEYRPALNVEKEARDRLGCRIRQQTHPVEAVIALRYPEGLAGDDVDAVLETTSELTYCAVYPKGKRFPTTGWLTGSVCDLADLIHLVDVPETAFEKACDSLIDTINAVNSYFTDRTRIKMPTINKIFKLLGLTENPKDKDLREKERQEKKRVQAGRMSGAIIANALLFQERIANHYEGIPLIHQLFMQPRKSAQQAALEAWQKILDINYWPIFKTAKDIVYELDAETAGKILDRLAREVVIIRGEGLLYENDLTGHIFQKLIVDRKYLAAFYTLPTSAALLARIAVSKMKDIDWGKADEIGSLKIADFACGTGALLSAVYDQIANRYERTGGNPADLHKSLMEDVFHGFDVVHYATCLTASILSGKQPDITYQDTFFCTMPYGRRKNNEVKIGSLEFLGTSEQLVLQAVRENSDPDAKRLRGGQASDWRKITIPDGGMDLVIMNPPFGACWW